MPTFDFPVWLLSALLAPFGLVFGSFANVLIHRLPREDAAERNVVTKPSHCPHCKARIRWYQNIPLLSWICLRGKCASCGWRIPFRYPLVELLGGFVFAGSVWVLPFGTLVWLKGVICGYALVVLFFTDLTEFILPDAIQFPLMALGVLFTLPQLFWPEHLTRIWSCQSRILEVSTFQNGLQPAPCWHLAGQAVDWKASLIGLAAGYLGPALFNQAYKWIRKTDGMGMGDFKMLAWLGAFWGWGAMLGILFGGAALLLLFALPLLAMRKAGAKTMLPLGCPMALVTPFIVFFGPALWAAYLGLAG